jgi:hypothetical protein
MMNEHIEAYLKQHYCRDYFNSYGETVEDDHYFMYREDVDGLIELIVRECISIAQDRAAFDWAAPNDVNHIISEIKEHFGIE